MNRTRGVSITGVGLVTPIGLDEATFWRNLIAGKSGIRGISAFDVTAYKSKAGAEVSNAELAAALEKRNWNPGDRTVDMAMLAAAQALESAGLTRGEEHAPPGIGCIVGSGGGPSLTIEAGYARYAELGLRGIRPTIVVRSMTNVISSMISMKFRLTGPNYVVVSACASSTNAMGIGFRMVRDGYSDRVLCGGAETFFTPGLYGAWDKLGVMSRNPDPAKASRPFDTDRDGFVLGEGAAMVVLENAETAAARGARVRAELCGYGESSDAVHITRPSEEGQAAAIRAAMECAGVGPGDIGFINAHGTATEANDVCESRAIRRVLGSAADAIPVASNKSFCGHPLGAAGAMEVIATVLSLETGIVPPNLNLDNPDPECNVCLVRNEPRRLSAPCAIKNSFGFGGGNAVLVLRRYDQAAGRTSA